MGSGRLLQVTVGAALLGLVASLTLVPSAQAYEDWQDWNDYTVTGLPEFITGDTPFTVTVDGPKPVCGMSFNGVNLTTAPWAFTYPVRRPYGRVNVSLCDGTTETVQVYAQAAFDLASPVLMAAKMTKKGQEYGLPLSNNLDLPATVTITNAAGRVVSQSTLQPHTQSGWFSGASVVFNPGRLKKTTSFTVTASAPDGTTMVQRVVAPVGWSIELVGGGPANCTTVRWFYDAKGQPAGAKGMTKDIVTGLGMLRAQTGLTFARTKNKADAGLVFDWENMGKGGPSGMGGVSTSGEGTVSFNRQDFWPLDRYAGRGRINGYTPGRVWLVVHEVMHTLNLGHVDDRTQVMNPIGYVVKFGTGDLAGLHTLYPKSACRA